MNDAKDRLTIGITVVRLLEYGGLLRIHLYAHEPNPLPQSLIDHIAGHAVIMRAGRLSGHRMLVDLSSSLDYSIAHELFAEWCVGWHIRQSSPASTPHPVHLSHHLHPTLRCRRSAG